MTTLDTLFDSSLIAAQQPQWPGGADGAPIKSAVSELKKQPPLVFAGECDNLKTRIAQAASGRGFWLQGGDCAETFEAATADSIRNRIKTILQMAAVLQYYSSLPVVKVGRMAGQFAKPRSNDFETRGDVTLPAYRGDAVNGLDFNEISRTPDPQRLLRVITLLHQLSILFVPSRRVVLQIYAKFMSGTKDLFATPLSAFAMKKWRMKLGVLLSS